MKKGKKSKNVSKPKVWRIISVPFAKFSDSKHSNKTENLISNIITTKPKKINQNEEGVSNEDNRQEAVF